MQVINRNAFMFYSYEDDVRTKDTCRKRRQQIKILYSNTGGHVKTHLITQIQIYSGTYYVKRLHIRRLSVRVRTYALTFYQVDVLRNQQLTACKYGYEYKRQFIRNNGASSILSFVDSEHCWSALSNKRFTLTKLKHCVWQLCFELTNRLIV